jgi:hypothetical protein
MCTCWLVVWNVHNIWFIYNVLKFIIIIIIMNIIIIIIVLWHLEWTASIH